MDLQNPLALVLLVGRLILEIPRGPLTPVVPARPVDRLVLEGLALLVDLQNPLALALPVDRLILEGPRGPLALVAQLHRVPHHRHRVPSQ